MAICCIYKLEIDKCFCFYYGQTVNLSRRLFQHKKDTYNRRNKSYHRKLYKKIREQGIKKDEWKQRVIVKIICICEKEELNKYERFCVNLNHPLSLNSISVCKN